MNFTNAIIFFVVVASLLNFVEGFHGTEVTYVLSKIDNRKYLVRNLEDKELAADHLAQLRKKLKKIVKHIRKKHWILFS